MTIIEQRAAETKQIVGRFRSKLEEHLGIDKTRILGHDTCIYVVGSGGRGEMSAASDLDLFVARRHRKPSEIDSMQVRQAIARALFDCQLPDPSQGGGFLKMHSSQELRDKMGSVEDDSDNTFTARMLLILESAPLLGEPAYDELLREMVDAYWRNAERHAADYQPYLIVNDVVRYWRILLMNYEAKNTEKQRELEGEERFAERRHRVYKLRFSRCLACFSVLTSLLVATAEGNVSAERMVAIAKQTPIERLKSAVTLTARADVEERVTRLLELYANFLDVTSRAKRELLESFATDSFKRAREKEGHEFAREVCELLRDLASSGRAEDLFRHMVV